MRIGIFTETYQPTVNGVVVSIDTFRNELEKKGHEYFIFAPFNKRAVKDPKNVFRFPAVHFRHDSIYPLAIPMPYSRAKDQLPIEVIKSLDIIHVQHYAMMGQYGLSLAKEFSIPSLYTYHTMAELYALDFPLIAPFVRGPIRAATRFTANRATELIAPTPSVKKYLKGLGIKKPINVLATGIYTKDYKRVSRIYLKKRFRIDPHKKILLFVGRMAEEKNVEFLFHSFVEVLKKHPDTHLLAVGGGPDKGNYQHLSITLGIDHAVTFTGFLDRSETKKLFSCADIFAFPSVTDTQGIVILEAMAGGAVPVAIDRLGPHDIIEHGKTGMLTGLNQKQFSDTINDLLADPTRLSGLAASAKQAVKQYDAQGMANQLEAIYERLYYTRTK